MKYENRIVLFLDIIGFQKIIKRTFNKDNDIEDEIDRLYNTLTIMKEKVSTIKIKKENTKVITQFSDTIIVSFKEDNKSEIINFLRSIQSLIIELIYRQILCRGAISYGKLFHNENFVFGPAVIDAYLTESTAALYPRIILDRSILEIFLSVYKKKSTHQLFAVTRFQDIADSILKYDLDDKLYFDYFLGAIINLEEDRIFNYFKNLRNIITQGLRYKTPNIKIKYGWMKNKFNEMIENKEIPDEIKYHHKNKLQYITNLKRIE